MAIFHPKITPFSTGPCSAPTRWSHWIPRTEPWIRYRGPVPNCWDIPEIRGKKKARNKIKSCTNLKNIILSIIGIIGIIKMAKRPNKHIQHLSWPSGSVIDPQATSKWSSAVNSCRSLTCDWASHATGVVSPIPSHGNPLKQDDPDEIWKKKNISRLAPFEPSFTNLEISDPLDDPLDDPIFLMWKNWSSSTNHQQKSIIGQGRRNPLPLSAPHLFQWRHQVQIHRAPVEAGVRAARSRFHAIMLQIQILPSGKHGN